MSEYARLANHEKMCHSIFAVLFSSGRDDEPTVFVFVL